MLWKISLIHVCILMIATGNISTIDANFYCPQRSCGKVMFLYMSVILSTARVCHISPQADTPLGRHPPGRPPWADTPEQTTAGQTLSLADAPPSAQCMLGYGQKAGGTHPTGMHSCYFFIISLPVIYKWRNSSDEFNKFYNEKTRIHLGYQCEFLFCSTA